MTTLGILGVGYLGECLVEGLALSGTPTLLSPRNPDRAARLADRHACVTLAPDNAGVVAGADLVFLATRPADIAAVAAGLPWRAGQCAVSIAAGIRLETVAAAVAPATAFRAMPIAASRIARSPTPFHPQNATVEAALARLGSAHPIESETAFETAGVFGAFYALTYAYIGEAADWAAANGLAAGDARALAARMAEAAAAAILEAPQKRPQQLLDDLMTEGGITEAGLEVLQATGALPRWAEALDASLARARRLGGGA
ncbi:MAG: pyrroline-5-carboxylate reductase dimerization domain-containing protein [Marivibrio sp.]|uniref:pyrroline-5-carboxylate reductase dimerization domain-containing protein n=1 Tax=Marivibrio sp. TaxID=2039719 RepID=UPI0032EE6627